MKPRSSAVACFGALWALFTFSTYAAELPYRFQKTIPIGGEGNVWDYMSVDEVNHRLYVSHGNSVAVLDIEKDVLVGVVTNTPGVHGVIPLPEFQHGFISTGRENKVAVFDLKSLEISSKLEAGQNPDAMVYEPGSKELYVFNGRSASANVFDAETCKSVATVQLGGQPEFAAVDPAAKRVYNNLEDKSEIAVIDSKTHKVVERWPISPGQYPSGIAIDLAHHRLFVGCHNKLMLMVDSTSGKVVGSVPIGSRVDANAFDPDTQLAFASCADGTLTIAHEDAPHQLTVVQTLSTERGARTMALDRKTHRIFVASAKFLPPVPPSTGVPPQGPKMVNDSFGVMVYELQR
jgi:YVTN family beta-propeller protein